MENIVVREFTRYEVEQVLALYRSVGWSAYFAEPHKLRQAFGNSLSVFGAYADGRLVGLIRTVGDGVSVVFIQDVLVEPAHQRQGIGRRLVAAVLARYPQVRQIHLMTDDLPETVGFYQSVGFTPVEQIPFRAFTRLRYETGIQ